MHPKEELLELARDKRFTDVLVAGYLDVDAGIKRFHTMFENVYLEFEDVLIKVSSIGQYWSIGLQVIETIDCDFAIDEDDEFCIASIRHLILRDPEGSNFLASMTVFSSTDAVDARRMVLRFDNGTPDSPGDLLFIDPENTYGLHLGGQSDLDRWLNSAYGEGGFSENVFHI